MGFVQRRCQKCGGPGPAGKRSCPRCGSQAVVWRARYRGPDRRERSKTFERKAEAERFLIETETAKAEGSWVDPALGQILFSDYARRWSESLAHLRPGTRANIEGRLRTHLIPHFGQMSLAAIRPVDVRTWLSLMMKKDRAPSTVNATYRTLSKILRTAEIDGLIVRSPCIGIELARETSQEEMRFLEPAEIHRLAEAIDERYRPLIYTAAYTGMRWGELAGLRVERLNLLRGTVDVVQAFTEVSGHLHLGPTKTGARRTVVLPRFLAQMLGEHIGRYPSADGYVFTSAEGTPLRRRNFYKRHFKRAVSAAGLDLGLRFHDLRHTCAALLIAQGHHPKTIQEHLGHSSIRLTLDRYGHLYPSLTEKLRQGLEAVYEESRAAWMRPESEIGGVASADETAKAPSDLGRYLERTTGFEPATPTLAITWRLSHTSPPVSAVPLSCTFLSLLSHPSLQSLELTPFRW